MKLKIAYTPETAFMFTALVDGAVDTEEFDFEFSTQSVESLNSHALAGDYDVTVISASRLTEFVSNYDFLSTGAVMRKDGGPFLIMNKQAKKVENIAVPGLETTEFLLAALYDFDLQFLECGSELIMKSVRSGVFHGGVIPSFELEKADDKVLSSVDLATWWFKSYSRPLPLTLLAINKSLSSNVKSKINQILANCIKLSTDSAGEMNVDLKNGGRNAVRFFISKLNETGLILENPEIEFII